MSFDGHAIHVLLYFLNKIIFAIIAAMSTTIAIFIGGAGIALLFPVRINSVLG